MNEKELLRIENLAVSFSMYKTGFTKASVQGVKSISLSLEKGEILAVVGASGSGKSLLAHAIMGLLPYNATVSGSLFYKNEPLRAEKQALLRGSELAFIPQSVTYLDPTMKVGRQVIGLKGSEEERKKIFAKLDLADTVVELYPFQLSGGMARRVLVSTALISKGEIIIADEPTPGMAVKDAVEALQMLRDIANEGKGVILITHDLDLAINVANRVAVFYDGRLIDVESSANFHHHCLTHPYTKALFNALPQNEFKAYSEEEVASFLEEKEAKLC